MHSPAAVTHPALLFEVMKNYRPAARPIAMLPDGNSAKIAGHRQDRVMIGTLALRYGKR
jgi:hypothetical protein